MIVEKTVETVIVEVLVEVERTVETPVDVERVVDRFVELPVEAMPPPSFIPEGWMDHLRGNCHLGPQAKFPPESFFPLERLISYHRNLRF